MSLKNFLPLRREVMEHWIYQDNDYFKVWVEMLFRARFSKEPKKDIFDGSLFILNQGEFLFSRPTWSLRLKINPNKMYKLIKLLELEEMLTKVGRVGKSGATIYSVNNYQKYNNFNSETTALNVDNTSVEGNSQQPSNDHPTTKQQRSNNEATLKKNVKNEKKEYTDDFIELYSKYPRPENKRQTFTNYNNLLKQYSHQQLITCVDNYILKVKADGTSKQYMKSSSNFLGKDAIFEDYLITEFKKVSGPNIMDLSKVEVQYVE